MYRLTTGWSYLIIGAFRNDCILIQKPGTILYNELVLKTLGVFISLFYVLESKYRWWHPISFSNPKPIPDVFPDKNLYLLYFKAHFGATFPKPIRQNSQKDPNFPKKHPPKNPPPPPKRKQINKWKNNKCIRNKSIKNEYLAILCDLFGMVKWPFQRFSDLLGDEKVTAWITWCINIHHRDPITLWEWQWNLNTLRFGGDYTPRALLIIWRSVIIIPTDSPLPPQKKQWIPLWKGLESQTTGTQTTHLPFVDSHHPKKKITKSNSLCRCTLAPWSCDGLVDTVS